MKPLARMVAKMKLRALAEAAKAVRSELAGVREEARSFSRDTERLSDRASAVVTMV